MNNKKFSIDSDGRKTDLIFSRFSGSVELKKDYALIKTPTNPSFHWGNYLILKGPPKKGDFKKWIKLFDSLFTKPLRTSHYLFTWNNTSDDKANFDEFLFNNYDLDMDVVLTTNKLIRPKKYNKKIKIKKIATKKDWEQVLELQILNADPKYFNANYRIFKERQIREYQKMVGSGLGHWFGAFVGDKLVGDLGVFTSEKIGRYQNVGTHPDYRRQGICATLVFFAGKLMMREYKLNKLVMVADPDYHAARIYESVGFKPTEKNYCLTWWKSKQ